MLYLGRAVFLFRIFFALAVVLTVGSLWPLNRVFADTSLSKVTTVEVYNYHKTPPFVIGPEQGLSYDLVMYLNRKGAGRYHFVLTHLPKKRLERELELGRKVIVPWASAEAFQGTYAYRYRWTSSLMNDGNVFVSARNNPIEIDDPSSLNDKLVAGLLGYRYRGVDEGVRRGTVKRTNVPDERALLRLVSHHRVDVGIVSQSSARYLIKETGLEDQIHLGEKKQSIYARQILINGYMPKLKEFLNEVVIAMKRDPEWIAIMEKYHLVPSLVPSLVDEQQKSLFPDMSEEVMKGDETAEGEIETIMRQCSRI
ncbi:ABC transporter substrate-binding protein [Kiloniella sp. EL199]|uniref:substrate-binding periplasmic protein n=1 Tax=Kiloniella sp. EL199 TaxID=2107581 RepID=UPI000EA33AF3|nr:ABC transporter substrate-binding protein [Kiloniella sp. EL199]